jgi:hypothetical protein
MQHLQRPQHLFNLPVIRQYTVHCGAVVEVVAGLRVGLREIIGTGAALAVEVQETF